MAKKKAKKRSCGSTTGRKLYLVENNGKLTVTRCKSTAKKVMAKCRKRAKKAKRGVCQMHTIKAKKIRIYRRKGRR
jgi:hypothetical protein